MTAGSVPDSPLLVRVAGSPWPPAPFFQAAVPAMFGGWLCAGCGPGYSPLVRECPRCPQQRPAGGRDEPDCEGGLCEEAPGDCRIGRCGC